MNNINLNLTYMSLLKQNLNEKGVTFYTAKIYNAVYNLGSLDFRRKVL